ncbi:hypothetical protein [Daejeonella oryzae]|uniref:hypothetical protein n=1 Tax=Daejeonella oryzae TaxID=1122943 RepID=UPI0003FE15FC|nr:hypothetical protein [Daejeonella oryzae]
MENHDTTEKANYSIMYILAVICGVLTAWVLTGSILYILLGAILGLLTAGFFKNVLMKNREV